MAERGAGMRRLLGLLVVLCLLPGLAGCGVLGPSSRYWKDDELTKVALNYLRDRYGEDFEIVKISWGRDFLGDRTGPRIVAQTAGNTDPLARFDLYPSAQTPKEYAKRPGFADGYLAVKMAPVYRDRIEERIGDLFGRHRVVVWLWDAPWLPGDTTPEQFMEAVASEVTLRVAVGTVVAPGTSEDDLGPLLDAVQARLADLPIRVVDLRLTAYTSDQDYDEYVADVEYGEDANKFFFNRQFNFLLAGAVFGSRSWLRSQ